jgi:hypothetical protein
MSLQPSARLAAVTHRHGRRLSAVLRRKGTLPLLDRIGWPFG